MGKQFASNIVWARQGTVGWRRAVIEFEGEKWTRLVFVDHRGIPNGKGRRLSEDLRPRDPTRYGDDKPTPQEAVDASKVSGMYTKAGGS